MAQPATSPDAGEIPIRPARPDEAAHLSGLAFRSKAYWGYAAAFMEACRAELSLSPSYIVTHPVFVVEQAHTVVGFYALAPLSVAAAELDFLFVDPAWIGRGLGRALIEHAKGHARGLGHTALVIQGDPHAIAFYRAAGGEVVGEKASASIPGRTLPMVRIDLSPLSAF